MSDHMSQHVNFMSRNEGRKPFRMLALWIQKDDYQNLVNRCWNQEVRGTVTYALTTKIKKVEGLE